MKNSFLSVVLACTILLTASGCDLISDLFASDEAEILAFEVPNSRSPAIIDAPQRTISVTVDPTDLRTLDPIVTASEGASVTPTEIKDGLPATFIVTAEDGSTAKWTVTVEIESGVSFILENVRVMIDQGIIHSTDPVKNQAAGDNTPCGFYFTLPDLSVLNVFKTAYEPSTATAGEPEVFWQGEFEGQQPGTFKSVSAPHGFMDFTNEADSYRSISSKEFIMEVLSYDAAGGCITGTFSGTVRKISNDDPATTTYQTVSDGFFKVLRLADDANPGF